MEYEAFIRGGAFVAVALVMATLETAAPRRNPESGHRRRWFGNLGVVVVAAALMRVVTPVLPVALAALLRERGWGLLPWLNLPGWLDLLVAVLALDLTIYWQHRAFHSWRVLWRLHRMHHADTFIDFSTGVRFHPLEYLLSLGLKLGVVALLGPSPAAVLVFELLLNGLAMFNHANWAIPEQVDSWLRLLVVTPDMHRVHHSTNGREMNHNYGFNAPWWDRIFGTYKPAPDLGHLGMQIGLAMFRDPKYQTLRRMLWLPFE